MYKLCNKYYDTQYLYRCVCIGRHFHNLPNSRF